MPMTDGVSSEDAELLCRIVNGDARAVPASEFDDAETDRIADMEVRGLVAVEEGEGDDGPTVTLSPATAARAGLQWDDDERRWADRPMTPERAADRREELRTARVRVVNMTDLNAGRARAGKRPVGLDAIAAEDGWSPRDDGGMRRPVHYLGTGLVWDGPDRGNLVRKDRPCQACAGTVLGAEDYCAKCDRSGQDRAKAKSKLRRVG